MELSQGTILVLVIIWLIVICVIWYVSLYNKIVKLKTTRENAWSDIDVQLRLRFDLVDNLVETVKWYAKHEKDTFKEVIEARNKFSSATDVKSKAEADNMLTSSLKSFLNSLSSTPQ